MKLPDESQKEFEGFVPTEVKEIREAAAKVYKLEKILEAEAEEWKERKKELEVDLRDAKHNMTVLMKKHKLEACQAGDYKAIVTWEPVLTVTKEVQGSDKLKESRSRQEEAAKA